MNSGAAISDAVVGAWKYDPSSLGCSMNARMAGSGRSGRKLQLREKPEPEPSPLFELSQLHDTVIVRIT